MTRRRGLSSKQHDEIAQIKEAVGKSDASLHHYAVTLDQFDRTAERNPGRDLSAQRARVLNEIHRELLHASRRLEALNTGLQAQEDLRQALIASAAGYATWSSALGSRDVNVIATARARMRRQFASAADHGERGVSHLAKGV